MPSSAPVGIPSKIKEESGTGGSSSASSANTSELASSFASSIAQTGGFARGHASHSELRGSGEFPARTASMGHAADVKRGLAANRARQMQQRLSRHSGVAHMKRTHSVTAEHYDFRTQKLTNIIMIIRTV